MMRGKAADSRGRKQGKQGIRSKRAKGSLDGRNGKKDQQRKRAFDQNSFLSSSIGPRVKLASLHVPDSATYLFLKHCHFRLNQAQGKSRFYSCFLIRVSYFLLVF
jgi:hypothetical protein